MLFFSEFLAKFSIKRQIIVGYIPIFLVLISMGVVGHKGFEQFSANVSKLGDANQDHVTFIETTRDLTSLQRNVLVYSYVGYGGVLKKIEHLHEKISQSFVNIRNRTVNNQDAQSRINRIYKHFNDYYAGFGNAVAQRKAIKNIQQNELAQNIESIFAHIIAVKNDFSNAKNHSQLAILAEVHTQLLVVDHYASTFSLNPDFVLIKKTLSRLDVASSQISALSTLHPHSEQLKDIQSDLADYRKSFNKMVNYNRIYIHLVNVVLAGKVVEMNTLSDELSAIVNEQSAEIQYDLMNNIRQAELYYLAFAALMFILSILCSLAVANSIATPVKDMTRTLLALANGKSVDEIPGSNRKDEMGEMSQAANDFKIMAEQLELQTQELEEFAYRTSHDLRSPLISAIGLIDISINYIKQDNKDKGFQGLELAQKSLNKLEQLVQDILTLAAVKNTEEAPEAIDLKVIVNDSLDTLSHMGGFNDVEFKIALEHTSAIHAPPNRMVLIIENLISNAIKYRDRSEKESVVEIISFQTNKEIHITVKDNGIGIPEKNKEDLFSMFKRFHPKTSFGSGLGLYMIKKSAETCGGTMVYEDTGDGSAFTLILPLPHTE